MITAFASNIKSSKSPAHFLDIVTVRFIEACLIQAWPSFQPKGLQRVDLLKNASLPPQVNSFLMSALKEVITERVPANTSQCPSVLAGGCHILGTLQELQRGECDGVNIWNWTSEKEARLPEAEVGSEIRSL